MMTVSKVIVDDDYCSLLVSLSIAQISFPPTRVDMDRTGAKKKQSENVQETVVMEVVVTSEVGVTRG